MPKPNYNHARKQKELARKARQNEKQQRRAAGRQGSNDENVAVEPAAELTAAPNLTSESGA